MEKDFEIEKLKKAFLAEREQEKNKWKLDKERDFEKLKKTHEASYPPLQFIASV
jgi:hypothetical protein